MATTEESPPDAPQGLRILAVTISQLKLGWAPPEYNNGALKGYVVYNGKQQVETTMELNSIVSGLAPGTTYDLQVRIVEGCLTVDFKDKTRPQPDLFSIV